jgi:carboxypeptidase T
VKLASMIALALAAQGLAALPARAQTPTVDAALERAEINHLMDQELLEDNFYRAWFPDIATGRKAAISLHAAVLETNWKKGYLVLQLGEADLARLKQAGFRIEKAPDFTERRNRMLRALRAAETPGLLGRAAAERAALGGPGSESIPNFSCYETVEETFAAAQGFTTTYPTLADWIDVGNSWQKTAGKGGWDMKVLKLTNKNTTGPGGAAKPKLFVNAAIHAREYATAPLVLAFAKQLLTGYGTNADATWILDHHEIHLLLQTNPDGRKKAETGLYWRKNTNEAYCGANSNNRGADLNRNFTNSWNVTHGSGSSGNACDETYRGPSAGSEPETQAVEAYVRTLWPDRRGPNNTDPAPADTSGIHIDVHSYGELVLWPWGFTSQKAPNSTALQTLGRRFAYYNGHYPDQSIGLYPTDGTSDSVSYGELGVAAYTFEIGDDFFQSCASYESNIKPGNLNALMYAAKVARTPYLTPAGPETTKLKLSNTDVPAGTPVTVTATVTDKRFSTANGKEPVLKVAGAEAFIDVPPWEAGATPLALSAADGKFNGKSEDVTGVLSTSGLAAGKHTVYVQGTAAGGQDGPVSAMFLTIH